MGPKVRGHLWHFCWISTNSQLSPQTHFFPRLSPQRRRQLFPLLIDAQGKARRALLSCLFMSSPLDASAAATQLNKSNRYKELFRRYGKIAIGVHLAVYASFFAGCYVAVESKVDVQSLLQRYRLLPEKQPEDADPANRTWLEKAVTGPGSAIALAFICNKALMPVRLPITIALTPAVARILRAKAKPV